MSDHDQCQCDVPMRGMGETVTCKCGLRWECIPPFRHRAIIKRFPTEGEWWSRRGDKTSCEVGGEQLRLVVYTLNWRNRFDTYVYDSCPPQVRDSDGSPYGKVAVDA